MCRFVEGFHVHCCAVLTNCAHAIIVSSCRYEIQSSNEPTSSISHSNCALLHTIALSLIHTPQQTSHMAISTSQSRVIDHDQKLEHGINPKFLTLSFPRWCQRFHILHTCRGTWAFTCNSSQYIHVHRCAFYQSSQNAIDYPLSYSKAQKHYLTRLPKYLSSTWQGNNSLYE